VSAVKHKVTKLFVNFEKEEKWLNDMASKGLNLIDYSFGRYLFEEGKPGEYIYRLELLNELPSHAESQAYIKFMEETGVECVATYMRWVFFRKKAEEGAFDLYTDCASRIKHYKRILWLIGVVALCNLFAAVLNVFLGLTVGRERGFYFNLYVSILSWCINIIFIPLAFSYIKKIKKLKTQKQLYE
jgi:hypothetical protein